MSPEERRAAQEAAMAPTRIDWTRHNSPLDALLGHFEDAGEVSVADAIRYGLHEAGEYVAKTEHVGNGLMANTFGMKYVIDYPDGVKP